MQNLSNAMSNVYGAVKYVAAHPKESALTAAFGGLGLLAACGGDKEATPLEIATSTPVPKPEATVQAQHDLTPEAYGLTSVPTSEIEQTVSDYASKARKLAAHVRTVDDKEGILHREVGDYGVIVSIKTKDGTFYSVNVRPNDHINIRKTIGSDQLILSDLDLDGVVDSFSGPIDEEDIQSSFVGIIDDLNTFFES